LHPDLPARIVEDAYGRIVSRNGLTLREREIVNVVALALGCYERQLYSHIRGAIRIGVKRKTLASVLLRVGHLTGKNLDFARRTLDELTA
jgi:alkylhydroperoxidase/carboxymuconolactone decarboxylase family protein YurZ